MMKIASKWHNSNTTRRVKRSIAAGQSDTFTKHQTEAGSPSGFMVKGRQELDNYTVLAAQVIAGRMDNVLDFSEHAAQRLDANSAYQEALERKVHRMETGSFYLETV